MSILNFLMTEDSLIKDISEGTAKGIAKATIEEFKISMKKLFAKMNLRRNRVDINTFDLVIEKVKGYTLHNLWNAKGGIEECGKYPKRNGKISKLIGDFHNVFFPLVKEINFSGLDKQLLNLLEEDFQKLGEISYKIYGNATCSNDETFNKVVEDFEKLLFLLLRYKNKEE